MNNTFGITRTNLVVLGVNFLHNLSKILLKQKDCIVKVNKRFQAFRIVSTAPSTAESKLESIFF